MDHSRAQDWKIDWVWLCLGEQCIINMIINSIILNTMQRESSIPRTPHSTDKIKIRQQGSKSLSKNGFNTPSPVIHGKNSHKEVRDLGVIKEKVKKKLKEEKKPKEKARPKEETKPKEQKETKPKKKTNFSTCLKQLKPVNLEKQKQLFFESNFQRNPFFVYPNISDIQDEEYKQQLRYDNADGEFLRLALRVLEKGAEVGYWQILKSGETLDVDETAKCFKEYISRHNIEDVLTYEFAENTISTTSVVHNNVEAVSTVIIGLPIRYTRHTIQGVMNHEIGTHFLRKYNDRAQKWFKDRKKYGLEHYLETQQGLAALNQMIPFALKGTAPPLLYRAALLYYGSYLASKVSFAELFHLLEKHQPDPEIRWKQCVRVKRGIADTSKSGGMYKDQIYFMGAIKILRNRHKINFHELHCGKISVDDYFKLKEKGQLTLGEKMKYPLFLQDTNLYLKCLNYIAEVNEIK